MSQPVGTFYWAFIALEISLTANPFAFAASDAFSSSNSKTAAVIRHNELLEQLENERVKLRILESEQIEIKRRLKTAQDHFIDKKLKARRMEVDVKHKSLYYSDTSA